MPKSCKRQKIDEEGGSCQFVAFSSFFQRLLLHENSNNGFFHTREAKVCDFVNNGKISSKTEARNKTIFGGHGKKIGIQQQPEKWSLQLGGGGWEDVDLSAAAAAPYS